MSQLARYNSTPSSSIQRAAFLTPSQDSSFSGSSGHATQADILSLPLRPSSVKQLIHATRGHDDGSFVIEGNEIGHVTVVAQVVTIKHQTANDLFCLDDATGKMDARHWLDGEESEEYKGISENSWVRIIGLVKRILGKQFIRALHIRPVQDPHEIFFHLAELMVAQVAFDRSTPTTVEPSMTSTPLPAEPAVRTTTSRYAHLPPVSRGIIEYLLSLPDSYQGTEVGTIVEALGSTGDAIVNALQQLENEGLVYKADEIHFKGHWCEVEHIMIEDVFRASMVDAGYHRRSVTLYPDAAAPLPVVPVPVQAAPSLMVYGRAAPLAASSSASPEDFGWSRRSDSPTSSVPSLWAEPWRYSSSASSLLSTNSEPQVAPPKRSPLEAFFGRFPGFDYQPSRSPSTELYRLSKQRGWVRGSHQSRQAYNDYKDALTKEFEAIYGTDANDIHSWLLLCEVLEIRPPPEGLFACRSAVRATHVNIVDLVESKGKTSVVKFETEAELSAYTRRTSKFFPRHRVRAGGVLELLLRHILD
ncbi:hypothetical protein FA95DRAFT_1566638 [Auriscalpium vulgare]|uniref:Uncharacterized protein n=1 Tax=Auriscalpium vulgare TaxID=40419 RepID=A0ACB8R8C1_9AGAM|nr:hypothetical protein FA95DRAFT_1566638 [Auriscalpium vulgare]